mmetsp:Transcript_113200/g.252531  ORF Transcript_113200/g.252531 Transcript_113200/m.252531 type:complete len:629 (-) Transcript_113200:117-2003(-)
MMSTMKIALLFLALATPAQSEGVNFLKSGQVNKGDVESMLSHELAGDMTIDKARLAKLEDSLRLTYKSLPKNAAGNLGHQAVRYVLHRLFVQRHGWFIRGLEPNNETWHSEVQPKTVKEWVPDYLQGLLEARLGERGTDLHELAALAAALEDLITKEARGRLETAYRLHGVPVTGTASVDQVDDIIGSFYVSYLLSGNFSAGSEAEAHKKKEVFARRYTGWNEAEAWLKELERPHMAGGPEQRLDFNATSRIAAEIGEKYYTFNDLECKSLKETLRDMEGKRAGRVRLPQFYKKALYSHWRFTEKADYLRTLGALDESDPKNLQVIVPNYIMSRPNCLESSNLYAICCRNECEDLMGSLETAIGAPEASAGRIATLVAAMSSDTVPAPRNLSAQLLGKLDSVAEVNSGRVPIHGRLFAQWMHHAYPRECPYPHEVGTTSPQTPDEWMQEQGGISASVSDEELRKHVEEDTCASDGSSGCGEGAELPWDQAEELLHQPAPKAKAARKAMFVNDGELSAPATQPAAGYGIDTLAAAFLSVAILGFLGFDHWRCTLPGGARCYKKKAQLGVEDHRVALLMCALTLGAYAVDLLDRSLFLLALCASFLLLAAPRFLRRSDAVENDAWGKCCV